MRIRFTVELACPSDAAWEALHSPAAVAELYGPVFRLTGLDPLPERFADGSRVRVRLALLGLVPLGSQLIAIDDVLPDGPDGSDRPDGPTARTMRDAGRPLTGPMALISRWRHEMTVLPVPGDPDRSIWRDELRIGGAAAPLLWPALALVWRWRRARIRRLSRSWHR